MSNSFLSLLMPIVIIALLIVMMVAWANIFKKAGYPSWYWVLMIIPIVNLVWILIFAFGDWPIFSNKQSQPDIPETPDLPDANFPPSQEQ